LTTIIDGFVAGGSAFAGEPEPHLDPLPVSVKRVKIKINNFLQLLSYSTVFTATSSFLMRPVRVSIANEKESTSHAGKVMTVQDWCISAATAATLSPTARPSRSKANRTAS
jgi:hypothetical protein